MASKRFNKGSPEWLMFQDYWKLCQKFWIPEDSAEWWSDLTNSVGAFWKNHKNSDKIFSKSIGLALIDTLEKKQKSLKEMEDSENG